MWARVAKLRIDIRLTENFVVFNTNFRKEIKELIKELELTKAELPKFSFKGLNR